MANSLNALARLREGRRRGNHATKGARGKGGAKEDEAALAAVVERFRERCVVRAYMVL